MLSEWKHAPVLSAGKRTGAKHGKMCKAREKGATQVKLFLPLLLIG